MKVLPRMKAVQVLVAALVVLILGSAFPLVGVSAAEESPAIESADNGTLVAISPYGTYASWSETPEFAPPPGETLYTVEMSSVDSRFPWESSGLENKRLDGCANPSLRSSPWRIWPRWSCLFLLDHG